MHQSGPDDGDLYGDGIDHRFSAAHGAQRGQRESGAEDGVVSVFPCPTCRSIQRVPRKCLCFCGKITCPKPSSFLIPHSCGEVCGRMREGTSCPHPCTLLCHPGPCPPCAALSPPILCFCGKTSRRVGCSESQASFSCGGVCGKEYLHCDHRCPRECHDGTCGRCNVLLTVHCFCGEEKRKVLCGSLAPEFARGAAKGNGAYSCGRICGKSYELCDADHKCERSCHPSSCEKACPTHPSVVSTCHCGKVPLLEPRLLCTDPIPSCGDICGRLLPCGVHTCGRVCHEGTCGDCIDGKQVIKCRCGSARLELPCFVVSALKMRDGQKESLVSPTRENDEHGEVSAGEDEDDDVVDENEEVIVSGTGWSEELGSWKSVTVTLGVDYPLVSISPYLCDRPCGATMPCNRHKCSTICCPFRTKKKMHPKCTQVCGRALSCGNHTCEELCHKGPCPPCRHVIWEDVTCFCGRTVLHPPLPCGTKPPHCEELCQHPRECGHMPDHTCHFGPCPPCNVLVDRMCIGGHSVIPTPCHLPGMACHKRCGKLLPCSFHRCQKRCHAGSCIVDGEIGCEDELKEARRIKKEGCGSMCGKKMICGHSCRGKCHPQFPCDEDMCLVMVELRCFCHRKMEKMPCSLAHKEYDPEVDADGFLVGLPCDRECTRISRERSLQEAFGIPVAATKTASGLVSVPPSDLIVDFIVERNDFVRKLEKLLQKLAQMPSNSPKVAHHFNPMGPRKRHVIHELAAYYVLESVDMDHGPRRSVSVIGPPFHSPPRIPGGRPRWSSTPFEDIMDIIHEADGNPPIDLVFKDLSHEFWIRQAHDLLRDRGIEEAKFFLRPVFEETARHIVVSFATRADRDAAMRALYGAPVPYCPGPLVLRKPYDPDDMGMDDLDMDDVE
eukprot:TRINITY_DN1770_c0_g1_i1.p1 TRINITY_DN1770_c0_g1~~TRINITY_DN1770_c0_g1_i1.p1  ORF type:complete len:1003 (-),score=191.10 TRINITY_DN1770_c0_g1_i1:2457-5135(-)